MIQDNRYIIINILENGCIYQDTIFKGFLRSTVKHLSTNYTHFLELFVPQIKRLHTFLYIEPIIIIQCF